MLRNQQTTMKICAFFLLFSAVRAIVYPKYMVSTFHGISFPDKSESQLMKEGEGVAFVKGQNQRHSHTPLLTLSHTILVTHSR